MAPKVLSRLRQRGNSVPVIVLTARNTLSDRVQGLNFGADDYLAKPFALPELEARIRALLRPSCVKSPNAIVLKFTSCQLRKAVGRQ